VVVWRYQRGGRSLVANLSAGDKLTPVALPVNPISRNEEEMNEDFEIPVEIEEVIEELIQGLRNSETIIRYVFPVKHRFY
jgi:hypothetical protein